MLNRFNQVIPAITLLVLFANLTQVATAGFFLTGAILYEAGSLGELQHVNSLYRYTTNSNDSGNALSLNGNPAKGISYSLSSGDNVFNFSWTGTQVAPSTTHVGLSLFFSGTSNDSFNPTAGSIAGDLTVYDEVLGTAGFGTVAQGTNILSYGASSGSPGVATANGNLYFYIGGERVEVKDFSYDTSSSSPPSGSFTLTVSAVPEPSSLALVSLGALWLVNLRRRRRLE